MSEFTPITGQWADPEKIVCRTCAFRDKTVFKFEDIVKPVGITRDTCEIYDGEDECKPHDILFLNAECEYYMEE